MNVNFLISIWVLGLAAFAPVCVPAQAQTGSGALPRGKVKDTIRPLAGKNEAPDRTSCFANLLNPAGGNGFISVDGKETFLLANSGSASTKKAIMSNYSIYSVDAQNLSVTPVVGLKQANNATLISHGIPIDTFSAVGIRGKHASCFIGRMSMVTIPIASSKRKPTFKGFKVVQRIVRSPEGYLLADVQNQVILDFDKKTIQTRKATSFAKGQIPLWYLPSGRSGVLIQKGKTEGLRRFQNTKMKESIKLKEGQKVVQQNEFFGFVNLDLKENEFEISELEGWSGSRANGTYKIKIPPAYTIDSAAMTIDFSNQIAVVYGLNFLAQQRWQRVFVFSYGKSEKPIQVVSVKGNNYFNFVGINPQLKKVVIEQADTTTRVSKLIKVYDFAENSLKEIVLPDVQKSK